MTMIIDQDDTPLAESTTSGPLDGKTVGSGYDYSSSSSSSLEGFLKKLKNTSNNTKKQEELLQKFIESDSLVRSYGQRSADCRELFEYLDETIEAVDELGSSSLSVNAGETNTCSLLACIEKVVISHRAELKALEKNQLALSNKTEIKTSIGKICAKFLDAKYLTFIKKCLQLKSTAKSKNVIGLQEMCVRILTLVVQESSDCAKKIALEFDYFNQHKNWLEKCLLMKQSNLREHCIYFLISFFKYVKSKSSQETKPEPVAMATAAKTFATGGDLEYLTLVKKIFLNSGPNSEANTAVAGGGEDGKVTKTPARDRLSQPASSSLVYCLFLHLHVDSWRVIEYLLQEVLFKLVRNDAFSKSEKVRFFNEKTLASLIKLFEWRDSLANKLERPASHSRYFDSPVSGDEEDKTLYVREMVAEFLKVLFSSTRHGISFYDRTLNLDQSGKNQNHLIFNALISLQRPITFTSEYADVTAEPQPAMNPKMAKLNEINTRTNKFIDELFLKTLRVCPDLTQRFLKVRCKQEANNNKDKNQDGWFIRFCVQLYESQLAVIRSMRKSPSGPASYLRCLARSDLNFFSASSSAAAARDEDDKDGLRWFVSELIVQTSMPICVSYPKLLTQPVDTLTGQMRYNDMLKLLTTSLKCLYEWKQVLNRITVDLRSSTSTHQSNYRADDDQNYLILENLRLLFTSSSPSKSPDEGINNFYVKLNLELLSKYLPRSELFYQKFTEISQKETKSPDSFKKLIGCFLDVFTLYLDFFTDKFEPTGSSGELNEKDFLNLEARSSFLNLMQIESFEETTNKFLTKVLEFKDESEKSNDDSFDLNLCLKYLEFINNFLQIKQSQDSDEGLLNLQLIGQDCDPVELNLRKAPDWQVDLTKHELIKNLVRIMFKFSGESSFKMLVRQYLKFIELHLNDELNLGNLQFKPRDLQDMMYLLLMKMRKKLSSSSPADSCGGL